MYTSLPVKREYMPPICKTASFGAKEILRRCNGMAGGVLLAAALVHLLPDAQKVRGLRYVVVEAFGVYFSSFVIRSLGDFVM